MNKKGLTLVELIVGISVSMLLMLSVGVFVSSGMSQLFFQQKTLSNKLHISHFAGKVYETLGLAESVELLPASTSEGILLTTSPYYDTGGNAYIGVEEKKDFCSTPTKHLFIKHFLYDGTKVVSRGKTGSYSFTTNDHIVKKGAEIILGTGTGAFGNTEATGQKGTAVQINSPAGIAEINNKVYVADSRNHRILVLSGATDPTVTTLMNKDDGLFFPTTLTGTTGKLEITHSGGTEKIIVSSPEHTTPLTLTGTITEDFNATSMGVEVKNINGTGSVAFDLKYTSKYVNPSRSSNKEDILTGSIDSPRYYFGGTFMTKSEPDKDCSKISEGKFIQNGVIVKKEITEGCAGTQTSTGTLKTSTGAAVSFANGNTIKINGIKTTGNTSGGNYMADLVFYSGATEVHRISKPWFKQGDGEISTMEDNLVTRNPRPTVKIDVSKVEYEQGDIILDTPIKSVTFNEINGVVTIVVKYYSHYDCENTDANEEHIKTLIFKKKVK